MEVKEGDTKSHMQTYDTNLCLERILINMFWLLLPFYTNISSTVSWILNFAVVFFFVAFRIFHLFRDVKGCNFWSMLGTYGHWAVRVLQLPHLLYHATSVDNGLIRGHSHLMPSVWQWSCRYLNDEFRFKCT